MAGFLYFRPGQTRSVSAVDVATWGLSYALENNPTTCSCHNNTPTKGPGVVFADASKHSDGRIKMDMAAQEWRKMKRPGDTEIWIGYWKDSPPQPADLARKNQLSGYPIKLADNKEWLCPVVRYFDEASGELKSNLPSYLDVDDNGDLVPGQVKSLHTHLWDLTAPFAEQMMSSDAPETGLAEINKTAQALLQVNYTVGANEIAAAKMLTTERMTHSIVAIAIDWPTYLQWREVSKKNAPSLQTVAG